MTQKGVPMSYTLTQYEKNLKKYIITYPDGSLKYIFFKGGKKALKKDIESYGIDDIIHRYEIEKLEGRKKKKKEAVSSAMSKQIEALQEIKTDIVLQLMDMTLIRGSKEHKALREQLHNIQDELLLIPGYETWDQAMSHFSKEELHDLRRLGEQKRTEKKERKSATIK